MLTAVFDARGGEVAERRLRALYDGEGRSPWVTRSAYGAHAGASGDAARAHFVHDGDLSGELTSPVAPAAIERMRGRFALAASTADGLLLGRGRFGGRPLFFVSDENAVVACSRLAPLARTLRDKRIDADALAPTLVGAAMGDVANTVYRRIHRVRSGEVLLVAPSGASKSLRIRPPERQLLDGATLDELAEELHVRIRRSVERALRGTARVVVAAGGGLDSSVILASVARVGARSRPRYDVVAMDFEGPGDDRPHMRALQEYLGIDVIRSAPENGGAFWRQALVIDGAPCPYANVGWWIHAMRAARERGAERMLTGEGGDEIFGGDFSVFAQDARRGAIVRAVLASARFRAPWKASPRRRVEQLVARPLLRGVAPESWLRRRAVAARLAGLPWAGPVVRRWIEENAGLLGDYFAESIPERHERTGLWAHVAEVSAQLEIAGGIERVDPFLDPDVTEFAARVPAHAHFCDDNYRGLLRRAARGLLPESVRLRADKADVEPAMLRGIQAAGGFAAFEDLANARCSADLGLVEPRAFAAAFDRLREDPRNGVLWMRVWAGLSVEAFLRTQA